MLSIISPVYNEAENLTELCARIKAAVEAAKEDFEIILVENGSNDDSSRIIREMRNKDPRIKYVILSRNFGHQGAIMAGLAHASGDAVISLDADLQHPPELIPKLVDLWRKGHEVVYTVKKIETEERGLRFFLTRSFYKFISSISDIGLAYGQSDYRLLDRKVVDVILSIPEKNKFLRGMVKWVGFSQVGVEYEVNLRKYGKSKFSFWNYINFAFDGIFSFSTIPLRVFLWCGMAIASFCVIWGLYYLFMGVINLFLPNRDMLPPGSATITVGVFFLGGVQLIGIGCLGEYIGRIYSQTKERPDFIVKEKDLD